MQMVMVIFQEKIMMVKLPWEKDKLLTFHAKIIIVNTMQKIITVKLPCKSNIIKLSCKNNND